MVIALFLINAPFVAAEALRYLVAGWFAIDAVRCALAHASARSDSSDRSLRGRRGCWQCGRGAGAPARARAGSLTWVVAIAGALRIPASPGTSWRRRSTPTAEADETVVSELGLADQPEAVEHRRGSRSLRAGTRAPIDRGWTLAFIVTLFAIHAGRMSVDATLLGLVSPAVAVLGDMLIAVLITLLVINPAHLLWRGPTRWIERRVWRWHLASGDRRPPRLVDG